MKNINRKTAFMSLIFALLVFTGCSAASDNTSAPRETDLLGDTTSTESGEDQSDDLEMLIPNRLFPMGGGTKEGYYYVEPGADVLSGRIRYIDYANAVDIPLSPQINSDHTGAEDTAYLDSIIGDYRMFTWKDHLYFIRSGASSYVEGSEFGELAAGAVYRMNLDGSERTTLYQGDGSGDLQMYAVGAEDSIYLFRQTTQAVDVIQVTDNGKDTRVAAQLPVDAMYLLVGCADGKMYFHVIGYDPNRLDANGEGGATHMFSALDVQTGELTEIFDLNPPNGSYTEPYMAGQTLYLYHPNGTPRVDVCDTDGTVKQTMDLSGVLSNFIKPGTNLYTVGDTLFIPCWDERKGQGLNVLVNAAAGTVETSNILLTQQDGKDSTGAIVLADNGNSYLAITAIRYVDAEMPTGDGTSVSVQSQQYEYSLIDKEKFTSDTPPAQVVDRMT